MSRDSEYHNRPEWSYSLLKLVIDKGINYAMGVKAGLIPGPASKAIDLGQLAHMLVLGGEDCYALKEDSGFDNFMSKAAKEWKAEQEAAGKVIIDKKQWEAVTQIVWNIEHHPHTKEYLLGEGWEHEKELYATLNGVKCRGKTDATKIIKRESASLAKITDLKTTSTFDDFFRKAYRNHYDLQAATYTAVEAGALGIDPSFIDYIFCVAETVAPYRVQFFTCSPEFIETGERKLEYALRMVKQHEGEEPNFLIEEIPKLGDFSERLF